MDTLLVDNGHARYALLHQHVDDIHDGRIHVRGGEIIICTDEDFFQRLSKFLRLFYIDCNELEEAVLGDDADDGGALRLVVNVHDGYAAGAGFEHFATCFVERAFWVYGNCFYRRDAKGALDICGGQGTVQAGRQGREAGVPRKLFRRNWSTLARASGFCQ